MSHVTTCPFQRKWTEVKQVCSALTTLEFNEPKDSSLRITDLILLCTEMEAPTDQNVAENTNRTTVNESDEIESCDNIITNADNDSDIIENSSSEERTSNPRGLNS